MAEEKEGNELESSEKNREASHFPKKRCQTSPQPSPWVRRGSKNLVSHLVYLFKFDNLVQLKFCHNADLQVQLLESFSVGVS